MPYKKTSKKRKRKETDNNSGMVYVKRILKGSFISLVIFLVLLLFLSLAVVKIGVGDSVQNVAVFLFALFSTFAGAFLSLMKRKDKGIQSGFFISLPAILMMCIILMSVCHDIGLKTLIMALLMMAGGALGGIAAVNKKKTSR